MFRALFSFVLKAPKPLFFQGVLVPKYPFRHDPPKHVQKDISESENISVRMET